MGAGAVGRVVGIAATGVDNVGAVADDVARAADDAAGAGQSFLDDLDLVGGPTETPVHFKMFVSDSLPTIQPRSAGGVVRELTPGIADDRIAAYRALFERMWRGDVQVAGDAAAMTRATPPQRGMLLGHVDDGATPVHRKAIIMDGPISDPEGFRRHLDGIIIDNIRT